MQYDYIGLRANEDFPDNIWTFVPNKDSRPSLEFSKEAAPGTYTFTAYYYYPGLKESAYELEFKIQVVADLELNVKEYIFNFEDPEKIVDTTPVRDDLPVWEGDADDRFSLLEARLIPRDDIEGFRFVDVQEGKPDDNYHEDEVQITICKYDPANPQETRFSLTQVPCSGLYYLVIRSKESCKEYNHEYVNKFPVTIRPEIEYVTDMQLFRQYWFEVDETKVIYTHGGLHDDYTINVVEDPDEGRTYPGHEDFDGAYSRYRFVNYVSTHVEGGIYGYRLPVADGVAVQADEVPESSTVFNMPAGFTSLTDDSKETRYMNLHKQNAVDLVIVKNGAVSDILAVKLNKSIENSEIVTGTDNVDIDTDDAETEYYNLQGVKVTDPCKGGLYIERRGTESRKVILK